MKKRIISALLATICALSSLSSVYAVYDTEYDPTNDPDAVKGNLIRLGEEWDWGTGSDDSNGETTIAQKYTDALEKLRAINVANGSSWQEFESGDKMTRAQFLSLAMKMIGAGEYTTDKNYFYDVDNASEFLPLISYAAEMGYITVGNGLFRPDSEITYIEASVILLRVLGLGEVADNNGGWTKGYIKMAGETDITDDVRIGDYTAAASKGDLYLMLVNTLESGYCGEMSGVKDGYIKYTYGKNLLEKYYDIASDRGVVKSVGGTGTLSYKDDDKIVIGTRELTGDYDKFIDLFGYNVDYWYRQDDSELIYAAPYKNSNNVLYISAYDIKSGSDSVYEYYNEKEKVKKVKIADNATFIYNGKLATTDIANLYKPEMGYVKFISCDGDDNYDYVVIESYKDLVISVVDTEGEKIYGLYDETPGTKEWISYDPDQYERFSLLKENGQEAVPGIAKKYEVISVRKSADGKYLDAVLSQQSVTGKIDKINTEDERTYIEINGKEYLLTKSCENACTNYLKLGASVTIKLNTFGYVAAITTGNTERGIYGYVISEKYMDDDEKTRVHLVNEFDEQVKLYTADKCIIDGKQYKAGKAINVALSTALMTGKVILYKLNEETDEIVNIDTVLVGVDENKDASLGVIYETNSANDNTKVTFKPGGNFGEKFCYDANNTIVFTVYNGNDLPDTRKYRARTVSVLKNDTSYHLKAYSAAKSFTADAVVVSMDVNTTVKTTNKELKVVTGIQQMYDDKEDEISYGIVLTNGSDTQTVMIPIKDYQEFGYDIGKGDIVTVDVEDGRVMERAIVVEYDASTGTFNTDLSSQSGTYIYSEYKIVMGYVYEVRDKVIMIYGTNGKDKSGLTTFNSQSADSIVLGPTSFKIVRMRDGEITMNSSSADEIRSYLDAGMNCSRVAVTLNYRQPKIMYIIDYDE